ncbi:MAG: TIGR00341 family protein [Bacteroidota bacterium]|nr:TIGR00341 family protein [Bacteroidota bacterium]MDP3145664.1 TIGR00341 family protein [Bacteroidota bacterium]MDP3558662.1 TIGR00341 family protein [Bacteroidota bacterium]
MKVNPTRELINFVKYRFNLDDDKASEQITIAKIRKGIEFKGTNLWALIFATIIASIGLNVNSTAVIIGAMLISPLMGPIMGIGLGAGIFDVGLIKYAFKNLLIATLIGLIASSIYFLISPLSIAQPELIARTTPTIWDVMIAFFGGMAGIVASSRKKFSNVIPGVAIATALMPPLCTAGYGIGTGHWDYFFGAFYLFIINCVFISIATFIMARFLKFQSIAFTDDLLKKKVQKWVGIIALLTILPSIFMAYRFVREEFFKQKIQNFINAEIKSKNIIIVNTQIDAHGKKAKLYVLGEELNDSSVNNLLINKSSYGLESSNIEIVNSTNEKQEINLDQLKSGIIEDLFKKQQEELNSKTIELENLKKLYNINESEDINNQKIIEEFQSLFGDQDRISLSGTQMYNHNNVIDTVVILYIKPLKKGKPIDVKKAENWLKLRLSENEVKIFIEK